MPIFHLISFCFADNGVGWNCLQFGWHSNPANIFIYVVIELWYSIECFEYNNCWHVSNVNEVIISNKNGWIFLNFISYLIRAMAISISVMFGRLGVVIGANTVAFLIDDHCETTFYLAGSILIGKTFSIFRFFFLIDFFNLQRWVYWHSSFRVFTNVSRVQTKI